MIRKILYGLLMLPLVFGCEGGAYRKSLAEIDTLADNYPAQARVFLNRADSNENKAYYKLLDIKILSNQKFFIHDYQDAVEECARLYEAKGDTAGLMRALYYKAVLWHEYYGDTATAVNLLLRIDSLGSAYSGSHDDRNMALVYDKLCKMGHTTYIGKLREASMLAGDSLLLARSLVYEAIATDRTHLADEAFAIVERCSPVKPQKARGELCTEYVQALIDKSASDSVIMRYLPEIATQNPIGYTTASQYLYEHSHPDFSKDYLLRHGPDVFDIGNHRTVFASPSTYALLSNMYYVALKDGDKQAADSIQRELRQIEYVFDKEENYRENKEIGLMYEGGNTRFRYMKAQTYVMYGIIAVLLVLLTLVWWHLHRIRRANRMIASLNGAVHQLKDVENPALSERCDALSHEIDNQLRRLKRREADITNYKQEISHLENIREGLMTYSLILQNRNISQIGRGAISQFLDSFRLIDERYSRRLSEYDLNPSAQLLCILYHIGKTDEEVMQIMQYTLANIRVRKSRIKSDTGVETFETLITK